MAANVWSRRGAPAAAADHTAWVSVTLLLPPSEGKTSGGSGRWRPGAGGFRQLGPRRRQVAAALSITMDDETVAAKLLGVKGAALDAARQTNRRLLTSPSLPAAERYRGVVWEHLSPATLSPAARDRASEAVVVLSGLLGAVRLDDPVPDYKLKMGGHLAPIGSMAAFWRPTVTAALRKRSRGGVVVNLLPSEHARAVDLDALGAADRLDVEFLAPSGRAIGHAAKAVKGTFARHLLEADDPVAAAADFEWDGWASMVTQTAPGHLTVSVAQDGPLSASANRGGDRR